MNYDTAKQLKDAGYVFIKPFGGRIGVNFSSIDSIVIREDDAFVRLDDFWYKLPTLSELIEACGNKFHRLVRMEDCWRAFGGQLPYNDNGQNDWNYSNSGSTPEIAVARLWRNINKPTA